jgi:hypothetical protein
MGKEVLMKNKTIGSSFDDILAEEGISEEVEAGAIKRIIAYQLQETIKNSMDFYKNDYLEIDMIEVPVVKRVVFQFNKPVELKFS